MDRMLTTNAPDEETALRLRVADLQREVTITGRPSPELPTLRRQLEDLHLRNLTQQAGGFARVVAPQTGYTR